MWSTVARPVGDPPPARARLASVTRARATLVAAAAAMAVAVAPGTPAGAHGADIRAQQWHLGFLKIAQAQQISRGAGVTVAVIDTGVADHSDLNGNVLDGIDTVPGGTGNGRGDLDGHGTGMAGLIAAHGHGTGNRDGAFGIAPEAKILPIRIQVQGKFDSDDKDNPVATGIRWAIAHGAKIISISQSAGEIETFQAISEAQQAGVLIFAAAGNTDEGDNEVVLPARYPWAVAVAGVNQQGNHAPTSVQGAEVELAAPGVNVTSTGLNDIWRTGTGTSDSTAIVAGVAALVWSKFPNLPATEVLHRMEATAVDKGVTGRDPVYGFGVVDPVAALTANVAPLPTTPKASADPLPTLTTHQSEQALPGHTNTSTTLALIILAVGVVVLLVIITAVVLLLRPRRATAPPAPQPIGMAPANMPPPGMPHPRMPQPGTTPPGTPQSGMAPPGVTPPGRPPPGPDNR